jgi:ubiquinone/menaquinone biosynthesis C-methylase UbiE
MPNYGNPEYWEARYKDINSTFDWLEDYRTLKDIIDNLSIPKETGKIINLGCGNSEFSENMYDDGYHNIYNIDISKNVINIMKKRNEKRPEMSFEVMDVRDLKYENNSIDLAVDKSTIDALLCGENSYINVAKMIKEVQRVLKVGGYYMIISYGSPENRVIHLERKFEDFDVQIYSIKNNYIEDDEYDKVHYIYLCKKLKGADEASKFFFEETLKELERQEKLEKEMNNYCEKNI